MKGYNGQLCLCLSVLCYAFLLLLSFHVSANATRLAVPPIDGFIARWNSSGGSELGASQAFLLELCDLLEVPRPQSPRPNLKDTSYLFEGAVALTTTDGKASTGRIDLYKRGCFIWESKQGSPQRPATSGGQWRRGTAVRETRGWDEAMLVAKSQAENYARALPKEEGRPPFLLIADIGYTIEIYADFSGAGVYTPFPSAKDNRLVLEDLRRPEIGELLRTIWTNPLALDPSRENAKVTQALALQLADVAASLEEAGHDTDSASLFLQRCIFTMFAEDVGLLPRESFTRLLDRLQTTPDDFASALNAVWQAMHSGGYSEVLGGVVEHIGSPLFVDAQALSLSASQIKLLYSAAQSQWANVDTAIFGALLERALSPDERHKLGAHYTPPSYVERLVIPTIMEPMREEWQDAKERALEHLQQGNLKAAKTEVEIFFGNLQRISVLDPSCGSGNFLATSFILLKCLESEVIQALRDLGTSEQELVALGSIEPHQFKGIEMFPRAATISELVLWLTALQQHYAIQGNVPPPVALLKPEIVIECRDAVLVRDTNGTARQADPWPQTDFIVGNPPFVGNFKMRGALGNAYTEALRHAYPELPKGTEYVMYWWHRAATLVREGKTRRFGLITTNSIRQVKGRTVIEKHLQGKPPLSLVYAVPDHPWIDATNGAQVRIAMTVGAVGKESGVLAPVLLETADGEAGVKKVYLDAQTGVINANLTLGANVSKAKPLKKNDGICYPGVKLHGSGFIVTETEARELGLGTVPGLEKHIRPYRNGRDLTTTPRQVMVIDLFGLSIEEVQKRYPKVYQWILEKVKPGRDANNRETYKNNWWIFGEPRPELRIALKGLSRYIVTPETAKRRYFVFFDKEILPDNMLIAIGLEDSYYLGILSSNIHAVWAFAAGGRHSTSNSLRYNKSICFDTFPFPSNSTEQQKARIRDLAEQLDSHRKARQAMFPKLTLTDMYAVLEQVKYGVNLCPKEQRTCEQADIATLQSLHNALDAAVADAYGWPDNLPAEDMLARLLELNQARAAEETQAKISWLRLELQKQ